jgi:hypothetical protein
VLNLVDQGRKTSFDCEVALGEEEGAGVVVVLGVEAFCFSAIPLLQTNFLPDFIHVNFLP